MPEKKRRGRPTLGKPIPVVLDRQESEIAKQLGGGIVSHGVRIALRAAKMSGIEQTRASAATYTLGVPPSPQQRPDEKLVLEQGGLLDLQLDQVAKPTLSSASAAVKNETEVNNG